jgi:hypothetical protein
MDASKPRQSIPMRAYHLALLFSLAMPVSAWAAQSLQPTEAGLQPLFDRMVEIRSEQRALMKKLEGVSNSSESKVRIQADHQALENERQCIEEEIMRTAHLQNAGHVKYALHMDTSRSPFDSHALRKLN